MRNRIGDVFKCNIDNYFFRYIGKDTTQLNSEVIAIYYVDNNYDILTINFDLINPIFYCHCDIIQGIKGGFWNKVGSNVSYLTDKNIFFRICSDFGENISNKSSEWWIWQMNQPRKFIGTLSPEFKSYYFGGIVPANSVLYKIENQVFDFPIPE